MGAAAFWIALAAVLITGGWWKSRSEAMKHETIRRIIERTGEVDEVKLKALFEPPVNPWVSARVEMLREILAKGDRVDGAVVKELLQPPPSPWADQSQQGDGYKALRIIGTITLFIALGLLICFSVLYQGNAEQQADAFIGFGVASVIAVAGAGLFYASRFCDLPTPKGPAPKGDRA